MHQHGARLFPTASPPHLPPYHSPTAGNNYEGVQVPEFHQRTGHVVAQQQQQQQVGGGHHDREQRYRYQLYERESAWAEVEKLSGYISRCAVAELASSVDITKEKYYDLFNIGVHLLKAIEALDPDRTLKVESYDSPPQRADVGRTSPTYGMQRQVMGQPSTAALPPTTTTTTSTMASQGTTANGPSSFPMGQGGRSISTQQAYSSPSDSTSFSNNPARSYVSEAGPGKGLPPPPPPPIGGIARYNQSIVSGMLSMGQPTGQPPPMPYKQLPSDVGASTADNSAQPSSTLWEPPGNSTTTTSGRKKRQRKVKRRDLHCHVCGVTDTPEWRRGPDGDHTLCNACGLHYAKALKKEREAREKEGRKHSIDMLLNQGTKPSEPTTTSTPLVERQ